MSPATLSLRIATTADEFDDFEAVEVFIERGLLRRAEDIAESTGGNIGDWLADLLLSAVEGRVSA